MIKYFEKSGVDLRIRQKPSHSYDNLELQYGIPMIGPIEQFLDWPDICVGIGATSTALIKFWSKGADCYHISVHNYTDWDRENLPKEITRLNFYKDQIFDGIFL